MIRRVRTAARSPRTLYVALLVAIAIAAMTGWLVFFRGGEPEPDVIAEQPIQHQPLAAGWNAVEVPPLDDTYRLTAESESDAGVARDTAFVLESKNGDLDRDTVRDVLRVDPPIEFDVKGGGDRVVLRPAELLRETSAYRFTLVSQEDGHEIRSWAFQTEGPLRVVQTLPRHEAVNVPLDSGIEITFSHDDVTGYEERITISPPVEGSFELHKRVVVFVPKRLAPETLYIVSVQPGVAVSGSDLKLVEPFEFSFETGATNREEYLALQAEGVFFARTVFEASTTEAPSLQLDMYPYQSEQLTSLPFDVYRYDGIDAFVDAIAEANSVPRWSYFGRRNFRLETAGLARVASFQADLQQLPVYGPGALFSVFPEPLDAGFYIVETRHEDATAQALLQVTDLAAYATYSEPKTLVWVNDLATKAPVEDAVIRTARGASFLTDGRGVAFFDTPDSLLETSDEAQPERVLRVEHVGRTAVIPLDTQGAIGFYGYDYRYRGGITLPYFGGSAKYWSYVYADRTFYHPTDEVHFWGVARQRDDFEPGEELSVQLRGGNYYDSMYQPATLGETKVRVSDIGTFEGSLSFEAAAPGSYTLSVRAGDEIITSSYVQIQNFVKPAYKVDIKPSRPAVLDGEALSIDIATEFFDGSPVPFVELSYHSSDGSGPRTITTDADGKASIPYTAASDGAFNGPTTRYFSVAPVGPEASDINGEARLYVLPSALVLNASGDVFGGEATVSGTVNHADLSAFEGESTGWYRGFAGGPASGRTVTANVTKVTHNRVEVGEYYDFIAKLVRKEYRYDRVEEPVGTFETRSAADGSFSFSFTVESGALYDVTITAADDAGRVSGTETYVSGDEIPYPTYGSNPYLSITETRTGGSVPYSYGSTYREGDLVDLTVRRRGVTAASGGDVRYLFVRSRAGIRSYVDTSEPRLQWEFAADDVPNVHVSGVQFNGRGYERITGDYSASYEHDARTIEVAVTADRDRYAPGDDVKLSVETRDANGDPVQAEALLSLVDEAIFRLRNWSLGDDILDRLYGPVPSGVLGSYVPSYTLFEEVQSRSVPAAAMGPATGPDTGGSIDPRSDFRDLALFQTVRTDADGRAEVTFTLPDNITSWRVTSRAVTADIRAGGSVTDIPVGLPFFVEVTASDEYLAADRPIIALRAFGTALASRDTVTYRVSAPSLGVEDARVTGEAFRAADFALPPLEEGEHELTVRAESGELQDAIVRTLRVVTSRLRRGEARFYELTPGTTLEGAAAGRTTVVFSDHNRGRYYDDLLRLGWTYGDRVDQMTARALAHELMREHFDAGVGSPPAFEASLYQTDDGGIALFPYADDDLLLSARMASVAPDRFGRNALAQYFTTVLDDADETRERSIVALFGLAAIGEPVLSSIDAFAGIDDLSPRERLYLGLAALAAGDQQAAREQYRQVMLRYGERRSPFVRVRAGVDQDDILELTALAADLGAGLGDPAADELFEYTRANATKDILVELEQISFLARAVPKLAATPVEFSYVLEGERQTQRLDAGRSFALSLTPEQLDALDPAVVGGSVGVATYFEAPLDPSSVATDPDVGVRRVVDVDGGGISEGELVRVRLDYTLAPQALDGCYQVTDIAPSGLRPVTRVNRPFDSVEQLYPYQVDGQRVDFCVYREGPYRPAGYYARIVTTGEYVVEPAVIQSQRSPDSFNLTPADTITIR